MYCHTVRFSSVVRECVLHPDQQNKRKRSSYLLFDYRYYNQDLTTGSLLIEVGGHGNTLEEALAAGRLAAQGLAAALGA